MRLRLGFTPLWVQLDVDQRDNHANPTESQQAQIEITPSDKPEEEEGHQVLHTHHAQHHGVADHHDKATGNLQSAGDEFRNGVEHIADHIGADKQRDD